jgi:hypothetical protein
MKRVRSYGINIAHHTNVSLNYLDALISLLSRIKVMNWKNIHVDEAIRYVKTHRKE